MSQLFQSFPLHQPIATIFANHLEGDGQGAIKEFDQVLSFLWTHYELIPDYICYDVKSYQIIQEAILKTDKEDTSLTYDVGKIVAGHTISAYMWKNKRIEFLIHSRFSYHTIVFALKYERKAKLDQLWRTKRKTEATDRLGLVYVDLKLLEEAVKEQ